MGLFGWDLPPGCSMRDLEQAWGDGDGQEEDREPIEPCMSEEDREIEAHERAVDLAEQFWSRD